MAGSGKHSGSDIRRLLRRARIGTLATLNLQGGGPYASLVNVATDVDGAPIILVSNLAWHTKNLQADGRASLLIAEPATKGDALAGVRATFIGVFRQPDDSRLLRRFLAHHPESEGYASLGDFHCWRQETEQIHAIAGFGRIDTLAAAEVFVDSTEAGEIEDSFIRRTNRDRGAAVQRCVGDVLGAPALGWRMSAVDPDGADFTLFDQHLRVEFSTPAFSAEGLNRNLAALLHIEQL